ncbi:MAG: aldo/keto reductase [candidate division Zixibacteria bacterium]|nr:aldo/keto reductase [Candidatus Tariuqbacter arcticus]
MTDRKQYNRRHFIKTAAAAVAGTAVLTIGNMRCSDTDSTSEKETKFIYRTLGKTGIEVPIISMGVMNANNPRLVRAALEAGITLLDTAYTYMRGRNEKMIGNVIKDFPRNSFVIATKVGAGKDRNTHLYPKGTTEKRFLDELETSLKRLKLDYVDILYLHNNIVKETVFFEPALNAFEKAKRDGKARFVGVSTHKNEPEIIQAAIDTKFYEVILTAYTIIQPHNNEIKKAVARAAEAGFGIVAMKNLGGGYLDRETRKNPINAKAAIKWVLQDENIHTVIPGFTTFDQMNEDLSIMEDLTLTEQEKRDLKLDTTKGSLYCPGCEKCLAECPDNLPIPDIMRAYMYAYGYRNLEEAQILIGTLNLPNDVCRECSECSVKCASGFNIPRKIRNVIRIKDIPEDFII